MVQVPLQIPFDIRFWVSGLGLLIITTAVCTILTIVRNVWQRNRQEANTVKAVEEILSFPDGISSIENQTTRAFISSAILAASALLLAVISSYGREIFQIQFYVNSPTGIPRNWLESADQVNTTFWTIENVTSLLVIMTTIGFFIARSKAASLGSVLAIAYRFKREQTSPQATPQPEAAAMN